MDSRAYRNGPPAFSATSSITSDDGGLVITPAIDESIIRTMYRVPLPVGQVSCSIKGKDYAVLDLSTYGLGLEVPEPQEFHIGTQIQGARICFADRVFEVNVEIVHVSPHDGDRIACGLRVLSAADTDYADCMERILLEIKSRMFTSSQPDRA